MSKYKIVRLIRTLLSLSSTIVALVFVILKIAGVVVYINEQDVNTLIAGLAAILVALIEGIPWVIANVKEKRFNEIFDVVTVAVLAAEALPNATGPEKRRHVLKAVESTLAERGIDFDAELISDLIEVVVADRNRVLKP